MREYNEELKDNDERKYAYDFDVVLRRFMMRSFAPFMAPGRGLELGCYQGDMTAMIFESYPDLTVIDAAEDALSRARERVGPSVRFVHSKFEDYRPTAGYEAIFLVHTLEHADDPVALLKRIGEWLSPTGRLFLAVPNANAPSRQIAVKMGLISHNTAVTEGEWKHGHRVTYTLDTLERDAKAARLNIAQRGGVFFKALANFQFDQLLPTSIISPEYLEGCYQLGTSYPDLCASIYLICGRGLQ